MSRIKFYFLNAYFYLQETCFPYFDDSTSVCFDHLIVEVKSVTKRSGFIQRDLIVSDADGVSFTNVEVVYD